MDTPFSRSITDLFLPLLGGLGGSALSVRALELTEQLPDADAARKRLSEALGRSVVAPESEAVDRALAGPRGRSEWTVRQWAASRICLAEAIDEAADSAESPCEYLFSLSHTYRIAVAACLLGAPNAPKAIGIDAESAGRPVSAAVRLRSAHPDDASSEMDPIGVWCIKEACFKADYDPPAGLSGYRICPACGKNQAWVEVLRDRERFRVSIADFAGHAVALAALIGAPFEAC